MQHAESCQKYIYWSDMSEKSMRSTHKHPEHRDYHINQPRTLEEKIRHDQASN